MKLGCNTVLFRGTDLATALQHIAWAGFDGVELAAIRRMAEHVVPDGGEAQRAEVRHLLADLGLELYAMEVSANQPERLYPCLALAAELGVPMVNIGPGGKTDDEASFQRACTAIGEAARKAAEYGVLLAVKPHVGQAVYNAATALRMWDAVCEPALGLNFDPSHIYRADEEPADVARQWGPRIITTHFRDCASREPAIGTPETQVPGRGAVDLLGTLRALSAGGYDGALNFEVIMRPAVAPVEAYPLARVAGIAAEYRGYMNRCLQELGLR